MKKTYLILLFVLLSIGQLKAQNAYYDAINLAKYEHSKDTIDLVTLSKLYAEMLSYSPNQKWDTILNDPVLRGLYNTLFNRYFINLNKKGIIALVSGINYDSEKKNHPDDGTTLDSISKAYNSYKSNINNIAEDSDLINKMEKGETSAIRNLENVFKDSLYKHIIDSKTLIDEFLEFSRENQLKTIYDSVRQKIGGDTVKLNQQVDSTRLYDKDTLQVKHFADFLKKRPWNDSSDSSLVNVLFNIFKPILKQESIKCYQDTINGFQDSISNSLTKIINNLFKLNDPVILFGNLKQGNGKEEEEVKKFNSIYNALPGESSNKEIQDASIQMSQSTASLINLSSISQTELIDAVAILMVSRFKQEVALSFIDWLRKKLDEDGILKDIFPNTMQQLNNTQIYELPRFGGVWRHVLSEDFTNLPENIAHSNYIRKKIDSVNSHDLWEGLNTMGDICKVAKYVYQQNALPDIVAFKKIGAISFSSKSMNDAFEILNLIDVELYDSSLSKYWLNWNYLNNMNDQEWTIFYALIRVKYDSLFRGLSILNPGLDTNPLKFKKYLVKTLDILNIFENNQNEYQKQFERNANAQYSGPDFWGQQINILASVLDPGIINLSPWQSKAVSFIRQTLNIYQLADQRNYAAMIHESFKMIDLLIPPKDNRLDNLLIKKWRLNKTKFQGKLDALNNQVEEFDALFEYARKLYGNDPSKNEICKDIDSKDAFFPKLKCYYKAHIGDTSKIENTKSLFDTAATFLVRSFDSKKAKKILSVRNGVKFGDNLSCWLQRQDSRFNYPAAQPSRFLDISTAAEFLTDLMIVKDSKDLSEVISHYSVPPNSYKIKRNSRMSIDLNGFIGTYGGTEFIFDSSFTNLNNKHTTFSGRMVYGFSAPIGITLSYGIPKRSDRVPGPTDFLNGRGVMRSLTGNCWSVSITVFDLAAVVAYRFEKGDNGALPKEVNWSQLFSPGFNISRGIRNTPLCLTAGVQYTPQLRNLQSDTPPQKQAVRVYAGLFFDIPFFNIMHH